MCMLDYGEGFCQSLIENDRVMHRTDRRCDDCGRPIAKGETYVHGQWNEVPRYNDEDYTDNVAFPHLDEGYHRPRARDWTVAIQCQQCEAAAAWLTHACSGFLYAAVKEDLWNHVGGDEYDERTHQLTRLYRWMDAKWLRRDGTLRPVGEVRAQAQAAIDAYDRKAEARQAELGRAA